MLTKGEQAQQVVDWVYEDPKARVAEGQDKVKALTDENTVSDALDGDEEALDIVGAAETLATLAESYEAVDAFG